MAFDSTIRVRQINQTELSGFVVGVVPSSSYLLSGNITPSGSGVYNLGSSTNYYKNVYSNAITLPSGSGIQIGSSFLTAYSSGGAGVVQIDGYKITSSGNFISIQGPQGIQGPSGATGITGATGTSVTGASYNSSNYQLTLYFNNNTSSILDIPPLTGATGVSLTGFYQSGSYIYPQFDNYQPLGAPVQLIAGPQGPPGNINFSFNSGTSVPSYTGVIFPSGVTVDSYYTNIINPPISLMRGMAYTINSSGLNTHRITQADIDAFNYTVFSGQTLPFSLGDYINYYADPTNGTGYWRMVFFPSGTVSGYYDTSTTEGQDLINNIEIINDEIYYGTLQNDTPRTTISFNTNFTALDRYQYGFAVYSLGGDTTLDSLVTYPTGYAIVCGDVYVSSGFGPVGPVGPSGAQGPSGAAGPSGASGIGVGIYSSQYQQIGTNAYQLRFLKTDGNYTDWINLPSGGPSGANGAQGPAGSLTNYFSGEFNPALDYGVNSTISYIGSTYINTGPSALGIYPPAVPWQLLAKSGSVGATGASGVADRYSSIFYVVSGFPTGVGTYANNITGITVNGLGLSGTGARFQTGQVVSFKNSGLVGYSYTPYQNIILSSNTYSGTYCWGQVNSYNSTSGILSFTVQSGGTGITNTTISGGYFLWYNYGNATINLGANLMSGAQGPKGDQGPTGPAGQPTLLRYSGDPYILNFNGEYDSIVLQPSGMDLFSLVITGEFYPGAHQPLINFDFNNFNTGKSIIIKVRNSGVSYIDIADPPLFSFSGAATGIRWPADQYSFPNDGYVYIYTIVRFPDDNGVSGLFGTYSNPYTYKR